MIIKEATTCRGEAVVEGTVLSEAGQHIIMDMVAKQVKLVANR